MSAKRKFKRRYDSLPTVLLFILPALIPLIVFWIYPILRTIYLSFTNWDYISPTYKLVGLKNYLSLFRNPRFYEALWHTLVFTA